MTAQLISSFHQLLQAAAPHHVHVGRAAEIARRVRAQTITIAFHQLGMLDQAGRQIPARSEARLAGGLVEDPDPAGLQLQQLRDSVERAAKDFVELERLAQRAGQ